MSRPFLTVALVGNPNTGKSTLFNALTGLRQHVGNYPGVTVELKKGSVSAGEVDLHLVDLPGTYSLAARSPDEMVTVDFILGHQATEARPDVVVSIVDAGNLDRHLYLTSQLMNLGVPVVLAVNLVDLADKAGCKVDFEKVAGRLGIPVVPIQANRGRGLDDLRAAIVASAAAGRRIEGPSFPEVFQSEVAALAGDLPGVEPFVIQRLLIDIGGHTERILIQRHGHSLAGKLSDSRQRLSKAGHGVPGIEARTRYAWIRQAIAGCITRPAARPVTVSDRLDRVLTHKIWGTLLFLALMFLVFETIFIWAKPLMDAINHVKDELADWIKGQMSAGPLRSLLADGIVNGVGSVLVFVPQILILFGFIAILEDCGYMARAAFLMDKIMAKCGLNGKSFIPLLSSVACAVPGIMATRVIENRRDRLATIMVAPLMSCSARLPLYMLLIAVFFSDPWWLPGLVLFGMYLIGLIVAPLVALVLKRTLLRGATPVFVMEMPSFKWPQFKTVVRRMVDAGWAFVYRAGTFIFASMILIWAVLYFPATMPDGRSSYDLETDRLEAEMKPLEERASTLKKDLANLNGQDPPPEDEIAAVEADLKAEEANLEQRNLELNETYGNWKRRSYLGQLGNALGPVFAPLGWDWRIGMAAIASFPAREVVVGTLGIIYNQGPNAEEESLGKTVQDEWKSDPDSPLAKHPTAVALGLMVFFALCCQCVSTLAVIRRETGTWSWPIFTFVYMTTLAYLGALATYQVARLF